MLAQSPRSESREARLTRLFDQHYAFVWRLMRRFGLEPSDADDAAQETFVIILDKLDGIDLTCERSYLYGTAVRVSRNAIRRRKKTQSALAGDDDIYPSLAPLPDAKAAFSRDCRLLDEILREIPHRVARVVILAEIEQLELQEIARLEEIPVGTVSSRLRKGRAMVQRKLELRGVRTRRSLP